MMIKNIWPELMYNIRFNLPGKMDGVVVRRNAEKYIIT